MFAIKPLGTPFEAIEFAREYAPYLSRLSRKYPQTLERLKFCAPQIIVQELLDLARAAAELDIKEAMEILRHAKAQMHLVLASADLSGAMDLFEITKALSDLADLSMQSALRLAIKDAPARDAKAFVIDENGQTFVPGLFIIAMGKHGAHELNYSSDIDLAAFFDRDAFDEEYAPNATAICVRLIGCVSRIMEDVTPENYVFRVDWRLRPDPASTPLAVSTQMAETYYESVGQNWERAAFIKARFIAGSQIHAEAFLKDLSPFIWRKYLDFAAVLDVGSILRQIHAMRRSTDLDTTSFDVKLGRGGIREIEFFTQTQQLILGGRDAGLRDKETKLALLALANAGRIDRNINDALINAYIYLRNIEHRIQMIDDEQTHSLPADDSKRLAIALLAGFDDLKAFDAANRACREIVRTHISGLFPDSAPLSSDIGSLVFTGVDHDEETLETIANLGFKEPEMVSNTIRGWHHGRIRATRTARARELLTSLTPNLLAAIADTSDADVVFKRFDDFFSGISAGVQTLALFSAEPIIMAQLCKTLGLSAKLAGSLAKKPAILDAMLSPRFMVPLGDENEQSQNEIVADNLKNIVDFEQALDVVRRFAREEAFRIGFHTLHGYAVNENIGAAYSDLAIACINGLLPFAQEEVRRQHGNFDGQFAICGWGKLGGRELSAESDLDLMLVYAPNEGAETSDGARPLSAESYYAKLTQKLVLALSAPTAEGELYEVDMQLRPSGKKGPVAVRFSSFVQYYENEAWTWEFQALTRLVPVAGDSEMMAQISVAAQKAIIGHNANQKTLEDIIAMRAKLKAAMKPRGSWDLKRLDGGIIDLEFIAQAYQLLYAHKYPNIISPNTIAALGQIGDAQIIAPEIANRLILAGQALSKVRQILAIVAGPDFDPQKATNATKLTIAEALEAPDFNSAQAILDSAREIIEKQWRILEKLEYLQLK